MSHYWQDQTRFLSVGERGGLGSAVAVPTLEGGPALENWVSLLF